MFLLRVVLVKVVILHNVIVVTEICFWVSQVLLQ